MKNIKIFLGISLILVSFSTAHAQYHPVTVVKNLDDFKCMDAGTPWTDEDFNRWVKNGRLPNDPSMPKETPVFASSDSNAEQTGTADGTVIVKNMKPVNHRVEILRANGKIAWINIKDIRTSKNKNCHPALLSNGRYGF